MTMRKLQFCQLLKIVSAEVLIDYCLLMEEEEFFVISENNAQLLFSEFCLVSQNAGSLK